MASGLDISIVGAGIAGLAAAAALRQQGHRVQIFEASMSNSEIGASISIGPNAERMLDHLGWQKENCKCVDGNGIVILDADEQPAVTLRNSGTYCTCHRVDLHEELKRLAAGDGIGEPARIMLGSQVVACNPVEGTVTLEDGQVINSDLVLGADGIRSTLRTSILGHVETAPPSGISTFRFLLDATKLEGNPEMGWFRDPPAARVVFSKAHPYHRIFACLCRSGKLVNVVAHFPDKRVQDNLSMHATRAELLAEFGVFHPQFLHLLKLADEPLLLWQLRALPKLPTWTNGCVALLGDAAHATFPTLGQGAAMALEDAATLGILFPHGTVPVDVPARLGAYEALRKERAEFIGRESFEQFMLPEKKNLLSRSPEMQKVIQDHDAVAVARAYFTAHFSG